MLSKLQRHREIVAGGRLRSRVCLTVAVLGLTSLGCRRDSSGDADPDDVLEYKGSGSFTVTGPSFAGTWELEGWQSPGPPADPDLTRAIGLDFESSRGTPPDEDRLWIRVELSSKAYNGAGTYECGINLLEPGEQVGTLCWLSLSHYLDARTDPGPWSVGPDSGPHPNCWLRVDHDQSASFDGGLSCESLHFRDDLTDGYNTNHPDRGSRVDVGGTWSFAARQIFRRVE